MRNAFLVAWREFAENAKTKGFWIGIFMLPFMLFLSFQVPFLLEKKGQPIRYFVLADLSGEFEKTIDDALRQNYEQELLRELNEYARENVSVTETNTNRTPWQEFAVESPETVERFSRAGGKEYYLRQIQSLLKPGAPPFVAPRPLYQRVPLPVQAGSDINTLAQSLRPWLRGERTINISGREVRLAAAVLIPADIDQQVSRPGSRIRFEAGRGIQYWSVNLADKTLRNEIEKVVNQEVRRREYVARGLDLPLIRQVEKTQVPIFELNPKKQEGKERVSAAETLAQWAPVGFVYLLWVAIFSISQMLLSNTIEEKSNRIIEVLLSSITPSEFIMGKLAGIAAVGLTMISAWIGSLLGILFWKSSGHSEVARQFFTLLSGSSLLPAFAIYFFFGYLLYAALILAIGSVCNTLKESQNYMAFISMMMMVPLLTMMFIPKDPNGFLARVLSWIPLYTPFIMMNRAAADPPLVDLIGTMVLLILTTAFALWMAVKIFRIGILRTGQPPRIIEMIRWLRTPKG
jgi:ABC-2 type transport system permease protein